MSLILDALRKSDVEHARQKAPGIATISSDSGAPQRSKLWYAVPALLLINAAFLAWLALNTGNDRPPATSVVAPVEAVPAPAPLPQVREPIIPSRKANVRSLMDESGASEARATDGRVAQSVASEPATTANIPTLPITEPDDPGLQLPTLDELRASGEVDLPAIQIALHVYNAAPEARFAFIGGRKVTEGGRLESGAVVAEITPYGVILDYQGRRFLLPRE